MNLEILLAANEQELLKLLTYMENHGGHASKQELCANLDISLKSLRSQIKYIQQIYITEITCVNQTRKIILTYEPHSSFLLLKKKLFQESPAHKILLTLLTEGKLTYPKLQKQLFLSPSTVKRYTYKLRELLKLDGLDLKNLKIIGPEEKIRTFYLAYIYETYMMTEDPFSRCPLIENYLNLIVDYIAKEDSYKISRFNVYRLRRVLYISYFRSLIKNDVPNTFDDCLVLPPIKDSLLFKKILQNKQSFPISLITEKEFKLLQHFLFNLPILMYDGDFYGHFIQLQKESNTLVYQLYKLSEQIFKPVFLHIDSPENLKKLRHLLFSINVNGLFFSINQDSSEIIGNRVSNDQSPYNLNEPSIEYLTKISEKINDFLKERTPLTIKNNYLINNYGFVIIQSSLYSTQKIKIGLFLVHGPFQMRIAFDYLKSSLQLHPILVFYNLLEEDIDCDFLITNDVCYFEKTSQNYEDRLLVTLQNIAMDTQKVNNWLLTILMEKFNSPYQKALDTF
ncbi:helix-turn-helix domain-containing protein [Enterococcus sp. LJL90]